MVSDPPSSPQPSIWRHAYAGTTLAVTILLGVYLGVRVDKHWSIGPWGTLAGSAGGVGIGLYNFFREFLDDSSKSNPRN